MIIPFLQTAFRLGISTRIDERVFAMMQMKSLPIESLLLYIYPNLYPIHYAFEPTNPPSPVQLTFANIDRNGVYLLDTYDHLYVYICKSVHPQFLAEVFNVTQWSQIPDEGEQNSTAASAIGQPGVGGIPGGQPPPMFARPPPPMMNGQQQLQQQYNPSVQAIQAPVRGRLQHDESFESNLTDGSGVTELADGLQAGDDGADVLSNGADEPSYDSDQTASPVKTVAKKRPCPTVTLPLLENATSQRIHAFISSLIDDRPFKPNFHILR